MSEKFQTFEDLQAYQLAREFRKEMYRVAKGLPDIEKYGLANQVRRAAVSLTNNIAEGHGRFHYLDQIKFMFQARGSLQELMDDLNVCEDEEYLPKVEVQHLKERGWEVARVLGGYVRHLRKCKSGESLIMREDSVDYAIDDFERAFGIDATM